MLLIKLPLLKKLPLLVVQIISSKNFVDGSFHLIFKSSFKIEIFWRVGVDFKSLWAMPLAMPIPYSYWSKETRVPAICAKKDVTGIAEKDFCLRESDVK